MRFISSALLAPALALSLVAAAGAQTVTIANASDQPIQFNLMNPSATTCSANGGFDGSPQDGLQFSYKTVRQGQSLTLQCTGSDKNLFNIVYQNQQACSFHWSPSDGLALDYQSSGTCKITQPDANSYAMTFTN